VLPRRATPRPASRPAAPRPATRDRNVSPVRFPAGSSRPYLAGTWQQAGN